MTHADRKTEAFSARFGAQPQAGDTDREKELDEGLLAEAGAALAHHELIKVKLLESCLLDRREAADELAAACGAEVAQLLGRTFLLYRRAEQPKLELPSSQES